MRVRVGSRISGPRAPIARGRLEHGRGLLLRAGNGVISESLKRRVVSGSCMTSRIACESRRPSARAGRRREEGVPAERDEVEPRLLEGRHLGRKGRALRTRHREDAHLPAWCCGMTTSACRRRSAPGADQVGIKGASRDSDHLGLYLRLLADMRPKKCGRLPVAGHAHVGLSGCGPHPGKQVRQLAHGTASRPTARTRSR